ncbi:MAG: hypothetical protein ACJ8C4_19700 [Gemmataceae bacterium]
MTHAPRSLLVTPGGMSGTVETLRPNAAIGCPLDEYTQSLPLADLVKLFIQIGRSLHVDHLNGITHGELRPRQILIDAEGMAHIIAPVTGIRRPDFRADVSGLGKLFFNILRERLAPPDESLVAIVARATSRDATEGYPSAQAIADDLELYLNPAADPAIKLKSAMRQWLKAHLSAPRMVIAVAAIVGIVSGSYFSVPATQAIVHSARAGNAPSVGMIIFSALVNAGWLERCWFAAAMLLPMIMGVFAVRFAKARTWTGAIVAGAATGLFASLVAWIIGAGGFITTTMTLASAREAQTLVETIPVRPAFETTNSFDIAADHPQHALATALPELASIPENSRTRYLYERLIDELRRGAVFSAWMGPIVLLSVGLGLSLSGALAWFAIRGCDKPTAIDGVAWIELAIPWQIAIASFAVALIDFGGGTTSWRTLTLPPSYLALAIAILFVVRSNTSPSIRLILYIAGITFFCRSLGQALPWWSEIPLYFAFAAGVGWMFVNRRQPVCQ